MNRMIRSLLALLVVAGLVFALAGCAQPTPAPTEPPAEEEEATEPPAEEEEKEEAVFKLGVMGPFSGPAARTGDEFRGAVEIAFEAIDYKIGHYNIELVWIDSQSDPAKATEAYEEAVVQKGIQAGLANWHSSVAVACMEVAAKHKIPHFFALGAADTVNKTWQSDPEKYFYWVGKGWPEPGLLTTSYVQALENAMEEGLFQPEAKTAFVWGEETDWARSFAAGMKVQLEDAGWEIVGEEYFPLDQTEFTPLLTKVKGMNPAIFAGTGSAAPLYSALIKQADEVGLESMIVADGLGWVGEWYDLTGDSSNYVIDQIPEWATAEGLAFAEEFEEKYGIVASTAAAGLVHDYANFFIRIANAVYEEEGELTTENLADFAKNKVQTGEFAYTDGIVMQRYEYSPETNPDPIVGKGYWIFPVLQYFEGDGKIIFPPEWAEQEFAAKGTAIVELEQPAEEATETFKLGVIGPFSGPNARTGDEFRGAAEIAFEDIEQQIGKYNIELVWIDSQSDPAKATEAYEEAIVQKGIQAGILNWHSSVAVACMEVAAKHQIPHFFALGAADTVNKTWQSDPDKYFYWAGKGWPEPAKLTGLYVGVLEDAIERGLWEPEAKTAALWGEETDWGRSLARGMKEQFQANGWEIVSEDYFPLDQTEFTPLLTKLKGMGPAVFAGTGSAPPLYSSLIKQADEVGLESVIIADGLGWVGEWYDLTGESSNYVIDQIPGWATDEAKAYAERFEEKYGLKPSTSAAGLCYDYSNMFIAIAQQVYEETGELSTEALADFAKNQLQTGEWTYTDGIVMEEYKYTPDSAPDPVVGEGEFIFPVLQYFDGEGKVIYPPQWAEQDFQPKP